MRGPRACEGDRGRRLADSALTVSLQYFSSLIGDLCIRQLHMQQSAAVSLWSGRLFHPHKVPAGRDLQACWQGNQQGSIQSPRPCSSTFGECGQTAAAKSNKVTAVPNSNADPDAVIRRGLSNSCLAPSMHADREQKAQLSAVLG